MLDQPTKIHTAPELRIDSPLADYQQAKLVLAGTRSARLGEPSALNFAEADNIYATDGNTHAKDGGKFIPERVDGTLQKRLDDVQVPKETAEKVLSEINRFGEDPQVTLRSLMQHNRVLAIGETHETPNAQRDLGAQSMADLKAAGATHLAIEAPMYTQPALDEFMRTGKLDPKVLPPLLRGSDYMNMLQEARKNGLKIVAVDADQKYVEDTGGGHDRPEEPRPDDRQPVLHRDQIMAGNVIKILDQDPSNKVVFWVGSAHLDRSHNPSFKSAADYLKEKTSTATIMPVYDDERNESLYPLAEITAQLKRPVAVPTEKASTLGGLPDSALTDVNTQWMRDWDYVFIYPGKPR